MQCYTELLPPTGVTHALTVPFLSATESNLVVIRTSVLQIFSLLKTTGTEDGKANDGLARQDQSEASKLVLEKECALPGTVTDLSRVKILNSKSGGEAILLAFRNAKLSLVEWDPECQNISTISIHYYERDDLARSPWVPDLSSCGSSLSVDPSSSCAVFNFGIRNLAILPFHQPGDDLVMDDYGSGDEENRVEPASGADKIKDGITYQTPYASSFVLPMAALDPSLLHPISFTFLYEYREPTFGILYSQVSTSTALLHERKDAVFYTVFTLDLEQRASTTLLSVSRLPSDLFKVIALPPPVGGALLIGSNELVHIDQAGKTNAVGVNEFSRQVSAFSMADQSDLGLRLEGCVVERLSNNDGDLLMVLATGDMVLVNFRLDGRSVSGVSVQPIPLVAGGNILKSAPSCSEFLGDGRVFIGSEDADSLLLQYSSNKKSKSQSKQNGDGLDGLSDDDQSEDEAYEDDLYSTAPDGPANGNPASIEASALGSHSFRVDDTLLNIGPMNDVTFGKSFSGIDNKDQSIEGVSSELELVASQGSGKSGGLVVMKRELDPHTIKSLQVDSAESVWTVSVTHAKSSLEKTGDQAETEKARRQYMIVSNLRDSEKEGSEVYLVSENDLKPFKASEFNPNGDFTIDVGTLADSTRVIQVLRNEVRSYDIDLGLAQIYPVWDEDTSEERMAVSASFADPYLAILRDDSSLLLLQADDSGDLDEVTTKEPIASTKWLSCCLYKDTHKTFSTQDDFLLFLLNSEGKLFILRLSDQELLSVIDGVDCLQSVLSTEPPKRSLTRETLVEAVVADLGDSWTRRPYLIVRTENDELVIYRPHTTQKEAGNGASNLRLFKESNYSLPEASSPGIEQHSKKLRVLPNVSGLSTVFMPGASAGFVLKTSSTVPHVIRLRGEYAQCLSSFDSSEIRCTQGFVYVDAEGIVRICKFPENLRLDYSWPMQRVPVGENVNHLAYSSSSEMYVLGTSHKTEFKLPEDDELHPEWRNEEISFLPEVDQSSLKVVSPKTWSIVDSYPLGPAEHVTAVKNINLEVSENTHERRDMIAVGTAIARGEDIPARGCIYVFEVIKVVPDPEKAESDRKLKLIGKEPVKGAITALSGIGGQGFLIAAQGQKCMVRGLKEDGSLLPVAFMDMQCYVNVVKELRGTGMCILSDAIKGTWFAGYSEEPYKMSLFGKDPEYMEIVAADFLPEGSKLFILVADTDCNLHVLQYDPEDPKSSNGDRLLNRSKFHTGHFATTLTLLPRTPVSSETSTANNADADADADAIANDDMDIDETPLPRHQVLMTTQTGAVGLVTPLSEESYRRLSALQSQLTNTLEHPCGLNPRAYRAVESDGAAGRGMVDGMLLRQWLDLGKQRRAEIAGRVGAEEWEVRADLESVCGRGLGFL